MTEHESFTDVAVVGGGVVGLSLALSLARGGIRVAVIDRAAPAQQRMPAFDGRVLAIAQGSARILKALGAWWRLADDAQPIFDIRVTDGDSPLHLHYDHADLGSDPLGYIVEIRHLRRALQEAAAQSQIDWRAPANIATISRDAAVATISFDDGSWLRAALIVAADGRGSATRRDAGIGVITLPYRQTALVCTVAHERPHQGIAHERFLNAGPFAILPMTGRRSSLVWTERADLAPAIAALESDAFLAELRLRFGDFLGRVKVTGPRWSYPLELSYAKRTSDQRLVLIGDAAHGIHPIAGQGFNLGLRDAAILSEMVIDAARLGEDLGAASLLRRYARRRIPDRISMGVVTDGLNRLFSNDLAPLRFIRDLGLAAVDQLPPLKRVFMQHAMGLMGDVPRAARTARIASRGRSTRYGSRLRPSRASASK